MLNLRSLHPTSVTVEVAPGRQVLQRGVKAQALDFVETGRIALGVWDGRALVHQTGLLEGPCWIDASSAVLGQAAVVDGVAESAVHLRSLPMADVRQWLAALPSPARSLLLDLAQESRRQTEFAISRLAKDAESRCAEWLLSHATEIERGVMAVELQQRKRSIAAQLGIAPETFSRVLRHLRDQSLIAGTGRVLELVNPKALRTLAGV
jgi:CRP-like cAMP-binding protein